MLPPAVRLRRRAEFTPAVRRGRRAAAGGLVLHLLAVPETGVRVGFVVARAVGGAVIRNRVRRRLRHLVAGRLTRLPDGSRLVVRATPEAATMSSADLGRALDRALDRMLGGTAEAASR